MHLCREFSCVWNRLHAQTRIETQALNGLQRSFRNNPQLSIQRKKGGRSTDGIKHCRTYESFEERWFGRPTVTEDFDRLDVVARPHEKIAEQQGSPSVKVMIHVGWIVSAPHNLGLCRNHQNCSSARTEPSPQLAKHVERVFHVLQGMMGDDGIKPLSDWNVFNCRYNVV